MQIRYRHRLGANEAYRRIDGLLTRLQEHYSDQLSDIYTNWDSDHRRMGYRFRTHGLKIEGNIQLGDSEIVLNGKLPLAARIFQGRIERAIRGQLVEQLGDWSQLEQEPQRVEAHVGTDSELYVGLPRYLNNARKAVATARVLNTDNLPRKPVSTPALEDYELEPTSLSPLTQLSSVTNSVRDQIPRKPHKNYLEDMRDYLKTLYHRSREWFAENPYVGFGALGAVLGGASALTLGPVGILIGATIGSFALGMAGFYSRHFTSTARQVRM